MSEELPAKNTAFSISDLTSALSNAWTDKFGTPPERAQLAVLCAQSALETGYGQKCRCFNLGGVKSVVGGHADWCITETTERLSVDQANLVVASHKGAKLKTFVPDGDGKVLVELPLAFRAFRTLAEGAAFYIQEHFAGFGGAWPFVLAGDAPGFATKLGVLRYYTADPKIYVPGVVAHWGVIVAPWLGFKDIAAYQKARGLHPDNDCGPKTYACMRPELDPPSAA